VVDLSYFEWGNRYRLPSFIYLLFYDLFVDKRYYKKKGPSFKERLRCPLCGKISAIGYFSQKHLFGVYRFGFAGRGKISCELVKKDIESINILKDRLCNRFLFLLEEFKGCKYYSQYEVDKIIDQYKELMAQKNMRCFPNIHPKIYPTITPNINTTLKVKIIPKKVVIE
jgi:hypothetical protein